MERRLAAQPYLGSGEYSIAGIAAYPWIVAARSMMGPVLGDIFERSPAVRSWCDRVGERPAVRKGMAVLEH
jgi:GST-like protein